MTMQTFIEKSDDGFNAQLKNFVLKIGNYQAALGLSTEEITSVTLDSTLFDYVMAGMYAMRTSAQNYTSYKDLLRYGGTGALGTLPTPPVQPIAPQVTSANMQARFAALIQKCVVSPNFTDAIASDLGVLGSSTPFNPQDGKPTFKIEFSSGGHPNLIWKKGKYQGISIYKSLDGISFSKLDKDFSPDFIDKTDLPAAGQSIIWYYKLIYLFKDEEVGQFSDVVSVMVKG